MKLSTGRIAFPIEFDTGDKEKIYFNPNDPLLMVRMQNFSENVEKRLKDLRDVELGADGMPVEKDRVTEFRQMYDIFCEELDAAFDSEVSGVLFKHCSPFAIVGGEYFIEQFLHAIIPEIEKQAKKANDRMEKHLAKYAK